MGNGSSSSDREARRRQQEQEDRRRQAQRLERQQHRVPAPMPQHLLSHQDPSFQRQHMQQQAQAYLQLQRLMMAMTQGGRGANQPAVQAVTEGRTITNDCAVNTHSLKFDKATSKLTFSVVNRVPCEVEVHVAVRLDVYQGIAFATPNRQRAPPRRVQIAEPNKEGTDLSFTLDEPYATIPERERTYSMHAPKQFPVVISVLYQYDPNAPPTSSPAGKAAASAKSLTPPRSTSPVPSPHEQLQTVQSKTSFDEKEHRQRVAARRAEHTCLQLDPHFKVVRQFFELEGGTYLVEHLFGGEHEARVVDEDNEGGEMGGSVLSAEQAAMLHDADGDDDSTCVICLTEERNTAVMPCRHLCLCRECADELRKHTPKCPVCRGPIQQLLAMKPQKK